MRLIKKPLKMHARSPKHDSTAVSILLAIAITDYVFLKRLTLMPTAAGHLIHVFVCGPNGQFEGIKVYILIWIIYQKNIHVQFAIPSALAESTSQK